jgi:hypothetical protein
VHLVLIDGFTAIPVVIDRLSDTVTASDVADAFFTKHKTPLHASSDRGSKFTSHFFRSLGSLHIRLHFTSGYHPSANGQLGHINSTPEQYLRIYCNYEQDNWSALLPLAEFAYNNAPHTSMGPTSSRHAVVSRGGMGNIVVCKLS